MRPVAEVRCPTVPAADALVAKVGEVRPHVRQTSNEVHRQHWWRDFYLGIIQQHAPVAQLLLLQDGTEARTASELRVEDARKVEVFDVREHQATPQPVQRRRVAQQPVRPPAPCLAHLRPRSEVLCGAILCSALECVREEDAGRQRVVLGHMYEWVVKFFC